MSFSAEDQLDQVIDGGVFLWTYHMIGDCFFWLDWKAQH